MNTDATEQNALRRQLALMLRGFSYDGRRAAIVRPSDDFGADAEARATAARPELALPAPEQAVDAGYRRTAAELWLAYQSEHRTPPNSVIVTDGTDEGRFLLERTELAGQSQHFTRGTAGGDDGAPTPVPFSGVAASRAELMGARVAVVTGGAQGFGLEIARELAIGGASVVLADRNLEAAEQAALQLEQLPHAGRAVAVGCDVSDEQSVARMIESVVDAFGGLDLLISNAGVLRAGSVLDLAAADFRLVTAVNYQAFFLCTKHTARALEAQNSAYRALRDVIAQQRPAEGARLPAHFATDIIQINSKSGLRGSNRNGAYAGSKFGAIGLVQSFALELVEHGIKVNAICPGNFFDGPLWSDPENGLFVQYLDAGKVPGAKTIADVKRHYESRVPMQRGCTGPDVARAVYYLVEQEYETGQALPVTGGQEMLH